MNKKYDLKEIVKKEGNMARFIRYRKGELIYVTDCGFEFPVPVSDAGDGIFNAEETAKMMMRYIRLHIESINKELAKD